MPNRDVTITLTAKDGTSQVFTKIGREAQTLDKTLEQTGKRSEQLGARFNAAGARMGAAFSAAQGALTEFARAAAESEASQARLEGAIEATGHSLFEYEDQLNAASEAAIQLGFDDEAAADSIALLTAATGDAGKAIEDLSLAEDLARARGISLEQATKLIIAAEQGRYGALARVGIVVDENASKEEALAQIRAQSAGAAERYSETTAGAIDRQIVKLDNLAEAAGEMLGPFQSWLAIAPGVSASYSVAATAIGALVPEMTAATAASALLSVALGPVGIVAAAVAGTAALGYFLTRTEEIPSASAAASEGVDSMSATIASVAASGADVTWAKDVRDTWALISAEGAANFDKLSAAEQRWADMSHSVGPEGAKLAEEIATLRGELVLSQPQIDAVTEDLNALFAHPDLDTRALGNDIAWYFDQLKSGAATSDQFVGWIDQTATAWYDYSIPFDGARVKQDEMTVSVQATTAALQAQHRQFGYTEEDLRSWGQASADANQQAWQAQQPVNAALIEQHSHYGILAEDVASWGRAQDQYVIQQAEEAEAKLRAQQGAYYGLADGVVTASEAQAIFKQTQDGIIASQEPFNHQISEYGSQLGYINDALDIIHGKQEQGIALSETETEILEGEADARARLTGGVEDATEARALEAIQYAENMKIGDEMNDKLGSQNELTATLNSTILELIAALEGIPGYVSTYIEADTTAAMNHVDQLSAKLTALDGRVIGTTVVVSAVGSGIGLTQGAYQLGGMIPPAEPVQHAQGGTALRGWSWVGEAGPELIYAPGARVLPHTASMATTQAAASGGNFTFPNAHITVVANDVQQFKEQMRSYTAGFER